jgi:hypothetical protein
MTAKLAFIISLVVFGSSGPASACAVCMGADDTVIREASNSTLWVLLALVCFIFVSTGATAYFLWRKATSVQNYSSIA